MTDYSFGPLIAYDPTERTLLPNAAGQVYAVTDTSFATPLPLTDLAGVSMTLLESDGIGILDEFVVTDNPEVNWVSGPYVIRLSSYKGVYNMAAQAAIDAAAALAAAEAASASLSTATDAAVAAAASAAAAAATSSNNDGTPAATGVNPIQLRYGSPAQWTAANPVLLKGQPGVSADESVTPTVVIVKIGNGIDPWSILDDAISGTGGGGGGWTSANFSTVGLALATAATAVAARSTIGLGNIYLGNGSPEGTVTAGVSSIYMRADGSTNQTFYVKESGTGNTGWVAKGGVATATSVGLGNVNNTSDASKPISTAQQAALDQRAIRLRYNGTSWPTRPADAPDDGIDWWSTKYVSAPAPSVGASAAHEGDGWFRHPDAV